MGKEYLVEGAMLMCVNGSSFNMLKIPIGHGYTSAGKKKANCRDCGKGGRGRGPDYGQCTPLQKRRRHHASDLGLGLRKRDRLGRIHEAVPEGGQVGSRKEPDVPGIRRQSYQHEHREFHL